MWTPWGESQHVTKIAKGITSVSTSSHGGIKLSPKRHVAVGERFPDFNTYADGAWYEEDCDVVVVILTFPEAFDDAAVWSAVRSAHSMAKSYGEGWKHVSQWLRVTAQSNEINARADKFQTEQTGKWEVGSMGSCAKGWNISFIRVGDQAKKQVKMSNYPRQRFYSDSELSALVV